MTMVIGNILLTLGGLAILFGSFAVLFAPNLFSRLLACSQIDTVGMGLFMFGIIIRQGISLVTLKIIVTFGFLLITNPVTTHSIGRSAYLRGEKPNKRKHRFEE